MTILNEIVITACVVSVSLLFSCLCLELIKFIHELRQDFKAENLKGRM